eukprot:5419636-Ditylum_brightwellii.AAC.1
MKQKVKKGTHSPLDNPLSGFQIAHQYSFTLQHWREQLFGRVIVVGVSTNCQNDQLTAHLPHT